MQKSGNAAAIFLLKVACLSMALTYMGDLLVRLAATHAQLATGGDIRANRQPEVVSPGQLKLSTDDDTDECSDIDEGEAVQQILDALMTDYKKGVVPSRKEGVLAHVEMHINDIPAISELQSDFTLDLMYSEMWRDTRLSYERFSKTAHCIPNITLDLDYLTRIWTPNTCMVNSKSAVIHNSPAPNVFLILYSDGTVWKNCRMMVRAPCDVDLRKFPFDTQSCSLIFESYSYNIMKVRLEWLAKAPLTMMKQPNLPDFDLVHTQTTHNTVHYPNGMWDQLEAKFTFKRRSGFFLLQAYVPTYMTIFVAWINFWMDPRDQLATRATLGISAFLAITLQFGNILKNQPPVSYVKAMDVWMLGCISFLFAALAELAIVSYILRNDRPSGVIAQNFAERRKERSQNGAPQRRGHICGLPVAGSDGCDVSELLATVGQHATHRRHRQRLQQQQHNGTEMPGAPAAKQRGVEAAPPGSSSRRLLGDNQNQVDRCEPTEDEHIMFVADTDIDDTRPYPGDSTCPNEVQHHGRPDSCRSSVDDFELGKRVSERDDESPQQQCGNHTDSNGANHTQQRRLPRQDSQPQSDAQPERTNTKMPYASIGGHLHPLVIFDERCVDIAYSVDKVALVSFPPLFMCFNLFYWFYYIA